MSLTTYIIAYMLAGALTGVSFLYVNIKYYGNFSNKIKSIFKKTSILVALIWPLALPAFLWHYRRAIKSVSAGRDWADDSGGSEALKKLMRMKEEDAVAYLSEIEKNFVRQINSVTGDTPQVPSKTDDFLN